MQSLSNVANVKAHRLLERRYWPQKNAKCKPDMAQSLKFGYCVSGWPMTTMAFS